MSFSFLSGLLAGFFIGLACQYAIKTFVHNRKCQEQEQKNKKIDWDKLVQEYPHFISLDHI